MARIITNASIELNLQFVVNESEARALELMASYGDSSVIEAITMVIGASNMKTHAAALRSFLIAIRDEIPPVLNRVNEARKTFKAKGGE